jgi:ubiquinone/menaquinone biosynthesis C-methylase UbiE
VSWLVASLYDVVLQPSERACVGAWRAELLADLAGEVAEIGAGTGYNLPYYPSSLARLTLAEPDAAMRRRLSARCAGAPKGHVSVINAFAESLPFPDASLDAVVGTLVLCTIADPAAALAEVSRVLKPGGKYIFLEHGAAEEGSARFGWQKRLEPVWKVAAGGCHLTRRADDILVAAGFVLEEQRRESVRTALPFLRPSIRGVARR